MNRSTEPNCRLKKKGYNFEAGRWSSRLLSAGNEESSAPGGYKMELILGPIGTTARAATHPSLSLKAKLVAD
jgi:hypothetical protein